MKSMYEAIMSLPLFKGLGHNQISAFLEKTHVEFLKYEDGNTVITEGEQCRYVKFIISGGVRFTMSNAFGSLTISEKLPAGSVIAADRLFGMDTRYPATGISVGNTGIMQFSKEQYFKLLSSDMIFLLNFVNHLSYDSQRPRNILQLLSSGKIEEHIALLLTTLTNSNASEIRINTTTAKLSVITNLPESIVDEQIVELVAKGLIVRDEEGIEIVSRRDFIEHTLADITF